mgnify:CR=1 FL=1
MARRYWKWLDEEGRSRNGGDYQWSLPTWNGRRWVPGQWTHRITNVEECWRGWHAATDVGVLEWIGPRCYVLEVADGARVQKVGPDKIVTGGPVRLVAGTAWDDRTARLFAARCALDALPHYEEHHPNDSRVADTIVAAVLYANGVIDSAARSAARSAADSAAYSAARSAAYSAARSAQNARLLRWLDGDMDLM